MICYALLIVSPYVITHRVYMYIDLLVCFTVNFFILDVFV